MCNIGMTLEYGRFFRRHWNMANIDVTPYSQRVYMRRWNMGTKGTFSYLSLYSQRV